MASQKKNTQQNLIKHLSLKLTNRGILRHRRQNEIGNGPDPDRCAVGSLHRYIAILVVFLFAMLRVRLHMPTKQVLPTEPGEGPLYAMQQMLPLLFADVLGSRTARGWDLWLSGCEQYKNWL